MMESDIDSNLNGDNMDTKIFLQGFNSKRSVNTSEGLNVKLKGKRRLLPNNDVSAVISQYNVYTDERKKCNKIRLTCQVNPVCSNVLFNSVTEIVKDEGSSGVSFINYSILSGKTSTDGNVSDKLYFKKPEISFWFDPYNGNYALNAIRDTQLTNDGYVYHCGMDIFNNHLVRSKTFKGVSTNPIEVNYFNTINDMLRNSEGHQVSDRVYFPIDSGMVNRGNVSTDLHIYKYDDIYTFDDCIKNRLLMGFDGWVGFKNKSKMKSYKDFWADEVMDIERPIMYMNGGDFVDMYPDRSLYSFVPKYNPYRDRVEKNWNYCLTYPSSSTTNGFEDIIETNNNSLKAIYFNENTIADNGTRQLVIYSIAKHGLSEGDYVNIYNTYKDEETNEKITDLLLQNVKVETIVNDYIFVVFSDVQISKSWTNVDNIDTEEYVLGDGDYYTKIGDDSGRKYYIVENEYINLDDNAQGVSYKKTVGGIECEYYVRIFSKIPNFRFASADTSSEYELYKNSEDVISTYQSKEYDFESHVSRLAFAANAYSDEIGEIVFTDDIDISNLKDNLGRPLSTIYITFVKNNKGYKEWYGYDYNYNETKQWNRQMISADTVEYSHCFGKVTCGIETSEESKYDDTINSINKLHNISEENRGYNVDNINGIRSDIITSNEIWFDSDKHYYGDLCYFDNYNVIERTIQPILYRFNTAQRELKYKSDYRVPLADNKVFSSFKYDEIKHDDYDYGTINDTFEVVTYTHKDCDNKKEGYYYDPHYEIRIKTFDKVQTVMPDFLDIMYKKNLENDELQLTSLQYHYLSIGDKSVIYDKLEKKYYNCVTVSGANDNYKTYTCKVYDEDDNLVENPFSDMDEWKSRLKVFKMDNLDVPSYAKILKDGTCRIIWRDILNNGFNTSDNTVEEYPFTNGAFYINKRIDIYVKRQDPYNIWGLYTLDDIEGTNIYAEDEDNYVKDEEIVC